MVTPDAVRAWVHLAAQLLRRARPVIDRANVFPVPDADTGTNMCLTLDEGRAGVDALAATADVHEILDALAEGALLGARGNSGVILSEYLRGLARGARSGRTGTEAAMLVTALEVGSRCAYEAVGRPRRGTILTAAHGAAQAARAALDAGGSARRVLRSARSGADDALRRSSEELDVLGAAGVLDAGAYGLVLVLDAMCRALGADVPVSAAPGSMAPMTVMSTLSVAPPLVTGTSALPQTAPAGPRQGALVDGGTGEVDGEFEVMYVVESLTDGVSVQGDGPRAGSEPVPVVGLAETATHLREQLREIGSSVAVVGGPTSAPGAGAAGSGQGLWQVHVHTDDPLEALRVGRWWTQRQVVVRSLAQQVSRAAGGTDGRRGTVGVVACTAAPGLVMDLARAGAVVVLQGSVPVTASDLRRAADETRAREVLVLPADRRTWEVAREWAAGTAEDSTGDDLHVDVATSVSDLHVVAAMAQWATATPTLPLVTQLEEVLAAVRAVRVPRAETSSLRSAVAGLAGGGTGSLLTVLADDGVPQDLLGVLAREAEAAWPGIDVVVLSSGCPSTSLVLGVE